MGYVNLLFIPNWVTCGSLVHSCKGKRKNSIYDLNDHLNSYLTTYESIQSSNESKHTRIMSSYSLKATLTNLILGVISYEFHEFFPWSKRDAHFLEVRVMTQDLYKITRNSETKKLKFLWSTLQTLKPFKNYLL